MYNAELKEKFIRDNAGSISAEKIYLSTFEAIEPYEKSWGADICTRSKEELEPAIDQIVGLRVHSKWLRIRILREYTDWCIVTGVPGARDDMRQVDGMGLGKIRSQMLRSPNHLQFYLDQICEPESEQTTDNIYRCFYWMAYSGMEEDDILTVKCSEVNFETMTIQHNGREYDIYREALPAFRNCVNLTSFVYKHPNYPPDKKVVRMRAAGDTVVRGIRSVPTIRAMRTELSRRSVKCLENGATELKMSYYRAWLSGLFYRTKEREDLGFPVSFSGAADEFMQGKTYKLDSGRNTAEAKKRAVERGFLQDYHRWRAAYN